MVNTARRPADGRDGRILLTSVVLIRVYLAVVVLTLAALVALTVVDGGLATTNAWGHAIIVAVFAVVLPLRARRATSGRRGAVRAVGLIAAVLLLVNVVEALLPGFVPTWMRLDMLVTALLMAGIVVDVVRWAIVHED